jgi:hypothetical protein
MSKKKSQNGVENQQSVPTITTTGIDTNESSRKPTDAYLQKRLLSISENVGINLNDDEIFTEKSYSELYSIKPVESENILIGTFHYIKKYYKPSGQCATNYLLKRIPILEWLPKYNVKEDLIADLIAGTTVTIHFYIH